MSKWIQEGIEERLTWSYGLNKVLQSAQTKYQTVDVVETEPFGKALLIDGLMQSSEVDEFVYHECLVHPAMLAHPNPQTIFIGGGGEGSTAREVLKHKTVKKCVMVDIDSEVVEFCKKHWEVNQKAFQDPRLEIIYDDAKKQLEFYPSKFDVIIMDLDDPIEGGPCFELYTSRFYELCKSKLNPGGIVVTQSCSMGVKQHVEVFSPIYATLKSVFEKVYPYGQSIYSFADEWGWNLAVMDSNLLVFPVPAVEIDSKIKERINGELRFLDGISHQRIFSLPKNIRCTLEKEKRVLTSEKPAIFYSSVNAVKITE